jgi:hypothetical protein
MSQRLMRNSERSTYRRCRLKWQWSYNLRLEPVAKKGALEFGTGVHVSLAERYPPGRKRGPHPALTFSKWYKENSRNFDQWDEEGNRYDALELGVAMLETYVNEYGNDDHIEIIAPEMLLQVDIYDAAGRYVTTWVGQGDAAYRDLQRTTRSYDCIGLVEHKTAKVIEENLRINSGYGEQGLSYFWGASHVLRHEGILKPNQQIDHVLFNWLRKGMPDQRQKDADGYALNKPSKDTLLALCSQRGLVVPRKALVADLYAILQDAGINPLLFGERSERQPSKLLFRDRLDYGTRELQSINWRLRAEAWEMKQVREGRLPLIKNPTKDCSWDCAFKEACEVHEMGGDYESILALEFEQWNPYEAHELEKEKT